MIKRGILAGLLIGSGSLAYLSVGGLGGAVLFAFGLIVIVFLELPLFTGVSGSIKSDLVCIPRELLYLWKVLFSNLIGTLLFAFIARTVMTEDISFTVQEIIYTRLGASFLETLVRAIGCGFIMELIVHSYKKTSSVVPVIFGIPIFIMSGFWHSIADSFYIFSGIQDTTFTGILSICLKYLEIVLGNFIGCSIRRFLV